MNNLFRWLTVVLLVSCSLWSFGQGTSTKDPVLASGAARILDVSGKVVLHNSSGAPLTAKRDVVLPEGTSLETGANSRILLRLNDGSEVLLHSHSSLILKRQNEQSGTSLFQLLVGRIHAAVTRRSTGTPSFQLGTPTAIIAVRGTQFDVEVNSHEVTEVDVEEGVVQVTSRKDAAGFVLVKAGSSTRVGPDMIPEAPFPTDRIRPDPREQQQTTRSVPDPVESRPPAATPDPQQSQEGPDTPHLNE